LLNLTEKLPHNRPGGNRFATDDFPVYFGNHYAEPFGQGCQRGFMPGEGFPFPPPLRFRVGPALAQVNTILCHNNTS